jgi:hypothetical protein
MTIRVIRPGENGWRAKPLTRADSRVGASPKGSHLEPTTYRITVRGRLTERLGSAFEGLDLEPGNEHTALVGEIRDQSHLYGVLDLVRGLGLELVSVETSRAASEPGEN